MAKLLLYYDSGRNSTLKHLSKQQCYFDCHRKHCFLRVEKKSSSNKLCKLSTKPLAARLLQTSSCKVMSKTCLQFALHAWIVARNKLQSQSWLWYLFTINYHTYWLGPYLRKRFNLSTLLWIWSLTEVLTWAHSKPRWLNGHYSLGRYLLVSETVATGNRFDRHLLVGHCKSLACTNSLWIVALNA